MLVQTTNGSLKELSKTDVHLDEIATTGSQAKFLHALEALASGERPIELDDVLSLFRRDWDELFDAFCRGDPYLYDCMRLGWIDWSDLGDLFLQQKCVLACRAFAEKMLVSKVDKAKASTRLMEFFEAYLGEEIVSIVKESAEVVSLADSDLLRFKLGEAFDLKIIHGRKKLFNEFCNELEKQRILVIIKSGYTVTLSINSPFFVEEAIPALTISEALKSLRAELLSALVKRSGVAKPAAGSGCLFYDATRAESAVTDNTSVP